MAGWLVTKFDTWDEGELPAFAACLGRDVPSIQIENGCEYFKNQHHLAKF